MLLKLNTKSFFTIAYDITIPYQSEIEKTNYNLKQFAYSYLLTIFFQISFFKLLTYKR